MGRGLSMIMEPITCPSGCLCFHRRSLRGTCCDYKIEFYETQTDVETLIDTVRELLTRLFECVQGSILRGRLIAAVNYVHLNDVTNVISERTYYFASYPVEVVEDVEDFVSRHLCKIASRMDLFSRNGSNLLIKNIQHIFFNVVSS